MSIITRATAAGRRLSSRAAQAIRSLAAAIDLADTARPLRNALTRGEWLAVGQEVTTAMLEGADIEDALSMIASRVRAVAGADASCLVLPGVGDDWVIEFADGDQAEQLVGIVVPEGGRARAVLETRSGLIVSSLATAAGMRVPQLARYGPALYVPLVAGQQSTGVIILLRSPGAPEFTPDELKIAESFARQAALALELSEARDAQDRAALLDERARIARDLHDLAIQHLFATGLSIARARESLAGETAERLDEALSDLDEAVSQIRSIVHALQRDAIPSRPMERLERELALARHGLGFPPDLELLPSEPAIETWADAADLDLVDDVVAVVREGLSNISRHAQADHATIRLTLDDQALTVTTIDDGIGIPPDRTRSSGLRNLAERAGRWGGSFEIDTGGGGTTLRWTVPSTRAAQRAAAAQ